MHIKQDQGIFKIVSCALFFNEFCLIQKPVFPSRDIRYDEFGNKIKANNSSSCRVDGEVIKVNLLKFYSGHLIL